MPTPREWAAKGKVRRITRWTESVMRTPTRPVTDFDEELHKLVADMFATMAAAEGVGLAAPQIDVDLSIFVFQCPDEDDRLRSGVVCNPVVTVPQGKDRRLDSTEEGCLSWPGAYHALARPDSAICEGQDENGDPIRIEGTGLLARCLQHETDHLSGIVFGDRLSKRSRKALDKDQAELSSRYPDDWPINHKITSADM